MIMMDTQYPKEATSTAWQSQKSALDKLKKTTRVSGLGALLTTAETEYKKINFALLDVGSAAGKGGNPLRINAPHEFDSAKQRAEQHILVFVRPARQAMRLAALEAGKIRENSNKLYTATTVKAAAKIETALNNHEKRLREIKLTDFDERKLEKQRVAQQVLQNFGENLTSALRYGDEFIDKVKQTPTPAVFNRSIGKASRRLTQNIGNVNKIKSQGAQLNKEQPTHLFEELSPWADKGDTLDTGATREEVLQALTQYERIVGDIRRWWG